MEEQEIIKNNKLIAEFLGWKIAIGTKDEYYTPHTITKWEEGGFLSHNDMELITEREHRYEHNLTLAFKLSDFSIHDISKTPGYCSNNIINAQREIKTGIRSLINLYKYYHKQLDEIYIYEQLIKQYKNEHDDLLYKMINHMRL